MVHKRKCFCRGSIIMTQTKVTNPIKQASCPHQAQLCSVSFAVLSLMPHVPMGSEMPMRLLQDTSPAPHPPAYHMGKHHCSKPLPLVLFIPFFLSSRNFSHIFQYLSESLVQFQYKKNNKPCYLLAASPGPFASTLGRSMGIFKMWLVLEKP